MSSMNIYRIAGDMCKLFSTLVLIRRLLSAKNAQGISIRTQELYLLVAITRYTDLFTSFYSWYNSIMKVVYISLHASVIVMIRRNSAISSTYDGQQDNFSHRKYLVLPCVLLAISFHRVMYYDYMFYYDEHQDGYVLRPGVVIMSIQELLWTFSIFLESVAILPQLTLLRRYRVIENLTGQYVLLMGLHRLLYIFNWVHRAYNEPGFRHHYLAYSCAVLQTILYADFFYCWTMSKIRGNELSYGGEGDAEYYDCDVNELRNFDNSTALIESSEIRMRNKIGAMDNASEKAETGHTIEVV
jgi:ER lumen protein retaining receptor